MYQKRTQKRNQKRKKGIMEEEEEEHEEEIRRGLSNKSYVCSCIIENTSLSFTGYSFTVYK